MRCILTFILFFLMAALEPLRAAAIDRPIPLDISSEIARVCQQISNDIQTISISREGYIEFWKDAETVRHIYSRMPSTISKEEIDREIETLRAFQEKSKVLAIILFRLQELKEEYSLGKPDAPELVRNLIRTMGERIRYLKDYEEGMNNLLTIYPDARRIFAEEANIMERLPELLLPFTSEEYQKDFSQSKPIYLRNDERKDYTPWVIGKDGMVQLTTSTGVRINFKLERVFNISKSELEDNNYIFHFHSGFDILLMGIPKAEMDFIVQNMLKGGMLNKKRKEALAAEKAHEERRKEALAAAKGRRDRAKGASGGAGAAMPAIGTTDEKPKSIEEILADMGEAVPPKGKRDKGGKGGKAARVSELPPSDATDLKIIDPALSGSAATEKALLGEKALLKEVTLRLVAKMAKEKPAPMPERPLPSGAGSVKKAKDILSILLREPLAGETVARPTHTIDWYELIYMLERLGFRNTESDTFMDVANHRLHLHAIHYDGYKVNYKLLDILFKQLAYYGFTTERLKELLVE